MFLILNGIYFPNEFSYKIRLTSERPKSNFIGVFQDHRQWKHHGPV